MNRWLVAGFPWSEVSVTFAGHPCAVDSWNVDGPTVRTVVTCRPATSAAADVLVLTVAGVSTRVEVGNTSIPSGGHGVWPLTIRIG